MIAPNHQSQQLKDSTPVESFEQCLRSGKFTISAELAPPDSSDADEVLRRARVFNNKVDVFNATDSSGANCHMSSLAVCTILKQNGYNAIYQISCRDRNRIAMQADLLGAATLGIQNILCLTGDGVQVGDHPEAKPVFDLDSISLLSTAKKMRDQAQFLSGRPISQPPRVFLGAVENPFVPPFDFRPLRLSKKIAAGAQFIQTQYCYDVERLKAFMKQVCDLGLHEKAFILIGVGPLASAKSATWIRNNIPGIVIPDPIIKRLEGAQDQRKEGIQICTDIVQEIHEIQGISGVHFMAYRMEETVADIVDQSGIR